MNTSVAFVAQISAILMGFFTRVVFTRMLSEGYVGINGLFTDILNILSLSELGVGTAITYALYRPIAENDISKQQILMRMFRHLQSQPAFCTCSSSLFPLFRRFIFHCFSMSFFLIYYTEFLQKSTHKPFIQAIFHHFLVFFSLAYYNVFANVKSHWK